MRFEERERLLEPGYLPLESGTADLGEGYRLVAALTRMPRCRAKMVHWWFGWLGGSDQYKWWHPTDHVFSDWENRDGSNYIGASHLVHEYLAGDDGPLYKLRINFRDPAEFFDTERYRASGATAVCARIGDLERPIDVGCMTHFVRDTDVGCEMRSRFWLGHVQSRDPAPNFSDEQAREIRRHALTGEFVRRLHQHAIEEMGYLADLLPALYTRVTNDATF